ncbi:hypothetical protein RhiirA1_532586 [Rhizophagus irregularis]|uniref:Uncharacterized protein n=1 Tax=Rhizophagus irregularis TaxID=588596 RepID=A0A2N0S517_9GLOM|nr:hypothetical protein RhiirA1_532586 [Rhizophagus irregularis]
MGNSIKVIDLVIVQDIVHLTIKHLMKKTALEQQQFETTLAQEEEEDLQIITSPKRSLNAYVPSSHPSYSLPRHSNLDKIRVCVRERCLSEKHINDVRKFAEKKGGPYLATKYINRQDPLIWQCMHKNVAMYIFQCAKGHKMGCTSY